MSAYDSIPDAQTLLAEFGGRQNELQADLAANVAKTLNDSKRFFKEGRSVIFYPTLKRDSGEYKAYWLAHQQEVADDLTRKGYVATFHPESGGMTISVQSTMQLEDVGASKVKFREPIPKALK